MTFARFLVRDVQIVHPATVPSYGSGTIADHDAGTTTTAKGWLHQYSALESQTSTRDMELSTHVLRLPAGTAIDVHDQVIVDGQRFLVDGPPSRVWRPGGEHHVKVNLRYVDG